MSFMQLSSEARELYQEVHWGKLRGCTLRLVSDSLCDAGSSFAHASSDQSTPNAESQWNNMVAELPHDQCAFFIANFDYVADSDGVRRSKVLAILWAPSSAPAKQKMLSAFCEKSVIDQCGSGGGIARRLQGGTLADLDYEVVREKILRTSTIK